MGLQVLPSRCFEAAEAMIRSTGLRRSKFGQALVDGLNRVGQVGLSMYFALTRKPIEVQGQRMHCRLGERGSFRSTLEIVLDRYEPATTRLFHRLLQPGMTVVDVGAHAGYFSLIAASQVGPSGKVYAFEPHPLNYETLLANVELNSYKNVVATRKAIAGKTCTMELFVNPKGSDRHTLYFDGEPGKRNKVAVEGTTLDDFFEAQNWPHVDFIKMDIEGAEPAALAGMTQTLKNCGVRFIVTEFSPATLKAGGNAPEAFLQELLRLGFSLYLVEEEELPRSLHFDGFSSLVDSLQDRGGTNLLCERILNG